MTAPTPPEPTLIAESVAINCLCEECGEAPAYTLICVDGTNMAVCRPCHVWLDHHSVPARTDGFQGPSVPAPVDGAGSEVAAARPRTPTMGETADDPGGGALNDGKEEAGSRFDAQSLGGGRRGEPASGELLPIALPPQDDTSEATAVGGQKRHIDGEPRG